MEYYFLKFCYRLIDILLDSYDPRVLGLSVALGFWLGFTPVLTIHWALALIFVVLFRINVGVVILSALPSAGLSVFTGPLMYNLGLDLLTQHPKFTSVWTTLYQAPFFPLTRFNYPHVMGSLVVTLALFIPITLVSTLFFAKYASGIYEAWRATRGYRMFSHYRRYIR